MKKVFVHKKTIVRFIILFVALINIGFIATAAMALTLNDGAVHDIDYAIFETVYIYNNVDPPHNPTTVNFLPGGYADRIYAYDESKINVSTGSTLYIYADDHSTITLLGGSKEQGRITLSGYATLHAIGGAGANPLRANENSTVIIEAGHFDGFFLNDNSTLVMNGGSIRHFMQSGGKAVLYNGQVLQFYIEYNAQLTVLGGYYGLEEGPRFGGNILIKGGHWDAPGEGGISDGVCTLIGYSFNIPFGTYTTEDNITNLIGILSDGSTFEWQSFSFTGGTLIVAAVPEVAIDNIIAFFDESVADGSLTGYGPGNSANGRLNALRNILEMAGDLINIGDIEGACGQLKAALKKCDDKRKPPDFVTGLAASELYDLILELMDELGCE